MELAVLASRAPLPALQLPGVVPPVWAAAHYGGALRQVILGFKESGRRDALGLLVDLLAASVRSGLARAGTGEVLLVPVPSSRAATRRRGLVPINVLASAMLARERFPGVLCAPVLTHRRRVLDSSGLDRAARARNLDGAVAVARAAHVSGAVCILVDDIVTTGASLAECARALRQAGAWPCAAAVVAATPNRHR
ncbi:ComF family protein [Gephyromycinifex aptenodytis]|uniref:ComF family protein n=1 Tax=Gephyromycinifex aptenodytis TaxID=2716227 RepID=UPI00144780D5|nr:phosphoribosyltransferase family protein [Gephyromycinifex aptenodytis]